jgi:endonuclease/exonuclease/phosphatase family metal-dependent hydrolase
MNRTHLSFAAFFVLLTGISCANPDRSESDISAMSFNIRYANPGDGVHVWANRKGWVAEIIEKSEVDIAGLQEALRHQIDTLMARLPAYRFVGQGRDDGRDGGEFSPILYRPDRVSLLTEGTFWLSPTPDSVGSVGWDAALPRIVTWAAFSTGTGGGTFYHFNTHFDHLGETARIESARLLRRKVFQIAAGSSYVVTGDFNAREDAAPYLALMERIEDAAILMDSRSAAEDSNLATFRGFEVDSTSPRIIDYVFFSPDYEIVEHTVLDDTRGNAYPSDHLPVLSSARLRPQK